MMVWYESPSTAYHCREVNSQKGGRYTTYGSHGYMDLELDTSKLIPVECQREALFEIKLYCM